MTPAAEHPDASPSTGEIFRLPPHFGTPWGRTQRCCKRGLDIVGALLGLIVLGPVLLAVGLAVWLETGLPVLYSWKVVGKRGRHFVGYKFRSMVQDAEALQARLMERNEMAGPVFKMKDDPRVTRVGRVIRRFSFDELPQLWNVLKSDMSLVGPRPPLQTEWRRFEPWQRRKLAVVPGITCLWQISGRSDVRDFAEWVRLDITYIENWSFWLDITILWRTIAAVVCRRGAY